MTVTISQRDYTTQGNKRVELFQIASGWSDADTITTRLSVIDCISSSFNDSGVAAADAFAVTASGGTLTLELIGTARAINVRVEGR